MDVQEKKDCYVNSVTSIAKKQEQGGCGSCCCFPLCTSTFYNKNKSKSGIGLFKFPAETSLRRKWLAAISRYRRKGGVDQFKITNATRVCEFHFKPDEIRVSKGIGRKTLLRGSVPSMFKFKQSEEKNVRKLPPKRLFTTAEKENSNAHKIFVRKRNHKVLATSLLNPLEIITDTSHCSKKPKPWSYV